MAKQNKGHISKPVYPGGTAAMKKFLGKHLKYPEKAKKAKVEGTVKIRYTLDYRGVVVDARVKKGIGHGCDEEALRVVRLLRFVVPQERKKKVRIHQDIQVHFHLPTPKTTPPAPASAPRKISYTITKSAEKEKVSNGSYTYTIKLK